MKISNLFTPRRYPGYIEFLMLSFRKLHKDSRSSFSQAGEDLLIRFAFRFLNVTDSTYLDIGAHHPTHLSNTFKFYQNGSHGVCIEPNPSLAKFFKKIRPRDTVLEIAIGTTRGETLLHVISDNALSTTSPVQAEYFSGTSKYFVAKEIRVPTRTVMNIIEEYFPTIPPNLVSLDIEGMDLEVLKSFDFTKCRPPVFCVETLTYDETKAIHKIPEIIEYMTSQGYFVFADTYLNTIFVDKQHWDAR